MKGLTRACLMIAEKWRRNQGIGMDGACFFFAETGSMFSFSVQTEIRRMRQKTVTGT